MTFGELKDALIIAEGAMAINFGIDLEDMEAVCLVQHDKNMICDKLISVSYTHLTLPTILRV